MPILTSSKLSTKNPWVKLIQMRSNDEICPSLKSLGPIHFVKIRLSNFLGNEFLVKMYTL